MPDESTRTVFVALGAGLAVALTKAAAAVITGSAAMAAEASHSLADSANDVFLFVAQLRSSHRPDDQHPLGYGREAYFWTLIAALGVFVGGAAFSFREGIEELVHPSTTSSFLVAYVVLACSTVLDLVSIRQSAGQMAARAYRYNREFLEESHVTSDTTLRAVFLEDAASVFGDVITLAALVSIRSPGLPFFKECGSADRVGDGPHQSSPHQTQSRLLGWRLGLDPFGSAEGRWRLHSCLPPCR
jgi:cation diffusion facilitator family transporter